MGQDALGRRWGKPCRVHPRGLPRILRSPWTTISGPEGSRSVAAHAKTGGRRLAAKLERVDKAPSPTIATAWLLLPKPPYRFEYKIGHGSTGLRLAMKIRRTEIAPTQKVGREDG